jgi:dihydroorotase
MSAALLITGGHILDPSQGIDKAADLLIAKGRIAWIGDKGTSPAQDDLKTVDATGLIV